MRLRLVLTAAGIVTLAGVVVNVGLLLPAAFAVPLLTFATSREFALIDLMPLIWR